MSQWGSGGQAHINVADFKPTHDGGWTLKINFPSHCKLANIQFWNG